MKFQSIFLLLSVFFISLNTSAQNPSPDFKIVGYYPTNAAMKADTSTVPFNKLTHINLAFVNPDGSGNFNQDFEALAPFIKAAHRKNVKVLYSIAGGGFHPLIKKDKRPELIEELLSKVLEYGADGIDVDLEWGYTLGPLGMSTSLSFPSVDPSYSEPDPNYGPFIMELARALKSHNKLITAALPSRLAKEVTREVLSQFDFINIMSYDNHDLRRPDRPGNHSSYVDAMNDLDYYRNTLNLPKEKLILGVPFYGRGFGPGLNDPIIGYMNYNDIVSTYAGAEWVDHWHLPNGYIMYYNGIPTIKNKTELAKKEVGGIMIWELLYDAPHGKKSLLNAIYETAH
ncbi:hypothetical protein K8352_19400 [Flavobacteriaceae bacterium F89]|uniref:chitinase n=1 Tax=Cerina litoralis TaxID=2874477 RepID=A0AAE3EXX7_9FLAO|nr:glycosyl hydrolase family 18 protein [Cerina litoralis]MCG2462938.1 hypothetical protein [Cerina litoralis]